MIDLVALEPVMDLDLAFGTVERGAPFHDAAQDAADVHPPEQRPVLRGLRVRGRDGRRGGLGFDGFRLRPELGLQGRQGRVERPVLGLFGLGPLGLALLPDFKVAAARSAISTAPSTTARARERGRRWPCGRCSGRTPRRPGARRAT